MLTREVMGWLTLGVLWVNTLLVVGAALQSLRDWSRRRRAMRLVDRADLDGAVGGTVLLRGVVGAAPEGVFAEHRVEQVGRQAGDSGGRAAILFADRRHASELHGGSLRIDGQDPVAVPRAEQAEIWLPPAVVAATAAADPTPFAESLALAKKARGYARTLTTAVRVADPVYVVGRLEREGDGFAVRSPEGGAVLVAARDPRPGCRRAQALLLAFVVGTLAAAAAVTVLATTAPLFGTVSTIGAALGLAYFLLVQPAGTAVRDAVRFPHERFVRGHRLAPAGEPAEAPAAARTAAST